jgi:outer membrane protein assembly factor BamB
MPYSLGAAFINQFKMLRRFNLINKVFFIALILLLHSVFVLASDDKSSPSPQWKLCWQLADTELTSVQLTAQNGRLFTVVPGGKLLALNSTTGETIWRTELGGEIVGNIPVNKNLVYVASQIAANKDKPALIIIRALSVETGLTVWQGELSETSQFTLVLQGDYLLAASGDSKGNTKVIALSADKGELRWTQILRAELASSLTAADDKVIFATGDKMLHVLKIANGQENHRFTLPYQARGKIVYSKGVLLFGDMSGNVSALDETDGHIMWTLRLGGAAQNILTTENGVLISSLDDFVYFQNILSGRRVWRKRLASRPLGAVLLSDGAVLLAASGENSSAILNLKKGNVLSQVQLGGENVAVASPIASNSFIFIPTVQGLLTFAPISTVCPAK